MAHGLGGHQMVLGGDGQAGMPNSPTSRPEAIESGGAGRFLENVAVYKNQISVCIEGADRVGSPDFFEKCLTVSGAHDVQVRDAIRWLGCRVPMMFDDLTSDHQIGREGSHLSKNNSLMPSRCESGLRLDVRS